MSVLNPMDRTHTRKISMEELSRIQIQEDLEFWLSRSSLERIAGIEDLRRTFYGAEITQTRTESGFSGLYPASKRRFS